MPMTIRITDVYVYPQGYAAAIFSQGKFQGAQTANVVDIGGYAVDLLQLTNLKQDMSVCTSTYCEIANLFQ